MEKSKSYTSKNYSTKQKVLANIDKTSANNQSKVVKSPWGKITHYKTRVLSSGIRQRLFSIKESKVFHNGGNYIYASLRSLIGSVA